jgi:hypothetical protein
MGSLMNQHEVNHAKGHFLAVEHSLKQALSEVHSALELMDYLEDYQVTMINSRVFDYLIEARTEVLNWRPPETDGLDIETCDQLHNAGQRF